MRLTDEQVASYQKLYKQTFGRSISKQDALIQGLALVRLVKLLSQPNKLTNLTEDNNEKIRRNVSKGTD